MNPHRERKQPMQSIIPTPASAVLAPEQRALIVSRAVEAVHQSVTAHGLEALPLRAARQIRTADTSGPVSQISFVLTEMKCIHRTGEIGEGPREEMQVAGVLVDAALTAHPIAP